MCILLFEKILSLLPAEFIRKEFNLRLCLLYCQKYVYDSIYTRDGLYKILTIFDKRKIKNSTLYKECVGENLFNIYTDIEYNNNIHLCIYYGKYGKGYIKDKDNIISNLYEMLNNNIINVEEYVDKLYNIYTTNYIYITTNYIISRNVDETNKKTYKNTSYKSIKERKIQMKKELLNVLLLDFGREFVEELDVIEEKIDINK